ncbi:MAG: TetR/AcrR family transcriptional regulator [Bacillota bacterium]
MTRAFNQEEKEMIHNLLLKKGKELFSIYGLKKTSIEDLTKATDIAQGTFYRFYRSKEDLYFDIIEEEEKALQKKLIEHLDSVQVTAEELKSFFSKPSTWWIKIPY